MIQATALMFALIINQPPAVPNGPPPIPDGPPAVIKELPERSFGPSKKAARQWPTGDHVLFVGVDEVPVGNRATFRDDEAYERPGVYWISSAGNWRVADGHDPEQSIREREGMVSRSAVPFSAKRRLPQRRGELLRPTVEDDRRDPRFAAMLEGMEPYETASQTQTTFRRVIGFIRPDSRLVVPSKWNAPGHLDGVEGWSSRLYKTRGTAAQVFLARQDPFDPVSAVTWSRNYPDGTHFADVLRGPGGEVFEVRMAEKSGGRWNRFTAFADASARPAGYVRPNARQCVDCHNGAEKPGTSAYGGSAIPGGDSVFSDPFDLLEAGRVVQGGNGTQL